MPPLDNEVCNPEWRLLVSGPNMSRPPKGDRIDGDICRGVATVIPRTPVPKRGAGRASTQR